MAIAARAAECARHFDQQSKAPVSNELLQQEWENQVFRFNLWCSNNFIFAPTRASMDWRLRDAPLLESGMVELLEDLESNLIKHSAIISSRGSAPCPDITKVLDELFRLSCAIRRSGALRRFVKVANYVEYDEGGLNLTEEFRKGAAAIVAWKLKDSIASISLQKRIVDTICLRQQHFAYLRARQKKNRRRDETVGIGHPMAPSSTLSATFSVTGSLSSKPSEKPAKKSTNGPIVNPSVLTATTAQPDRAKAAYSIKSYNHNEEYEVNCSADDLPPPPKIPLRTTEYECPYCFLACPLREFSGERWKKHMIQDLMPYVCVLEPCLIANTLFESGKDWLEHMRNQHAISRWTCMDGSHDKTWFFEDEKSFKNHMCEHHSGQFEDDDLDDLALSCHQQLPMDNVITECPFCPADHDLDFIPTQISLAGHDEGNDKQSGQSDSKRSRQYHVSQLGSEVSAMRRLEADFPEIEDEETHTSGENMDLSPMESVPDADGQVCQNTWRYIREALGLPILGNFAIADSGSQETIEPLEKESYGREPSIHELGKNSLGGYANSDLTFSNNKREDKEEIDVDPVRDFPHNSIVLCVQFSPDGNHLATASEGTARIFNVEDGSQVAEFKHANLTDDDLYVRSIRFSPDGAYLATGAEDGAIWYIPTQALLHHCLGHAGDIPSIDMSSDGRYIVSGSMDESVRVWDLVENARCARVLQTPWPVRSVALSPDGSRIAAGGVDGGVHVWDATSGVVLSRLLGHTDDVVALCFKPDSKFLFSGSLDRTMRSWDMTTTEEGEQLFKGDMGVVLTNCMTPDGEWLISGSNDGSLWIWDPETAIPHMMIPGRYLDSVPAFSVTVCPTGGLLAAAYDFNAKVWNQG
ncbi:hypothetical protein FE257_006165 [Aspergillus nanangensis]|uniref:Oxidoreductase acuF-like C2H2 type zinc-finger domain-containing protein n=1 Tax=Aspergillus nanangensis TaxID=2582783 RepID=A0AAD4CR30_ASPNN|nr:hypothetical protein FE257_006165 [Aspergillus nanangensis]